MSPQLCPVLSGLSPGFGLFGTTLWQNLDSNSYNYGIKERIENLDTELIFCHVL